MKVVHFNIDPMDLQRIEKMIRDSDTITTILPVDLFDRYSLGAYVKETTVEESKFFAMLDQNMFSRIIGVAKNKGRRPYKLQEMIACALLAFLQLADVAIEPNHAIYEIMDSEDYGKTIGKLSLFRAFDNLDSQILIELALGRRDEIPTKILKQQTVEPIEQKKGKDFRSWKIYRGFVLKMAIIDLQGGSPFDKLKLFIEWIYREHIFMSVTIIFGVILFSEKRFKRMLKIGSKDKDEVLKGVRNATWDINLAYHWSKKAMLEKENGIFWLLCTEDNALRALADSLIVTGDDLEQKKEAVFCEYLGNNNGRMISDKLVEMEKTYVNDSSRRVNKDSPTSDLYLVVDELEKQLLSVIANRKCKRKN